MALVEVLVVVVVVEGHYYIHIVFLVDTHNQLIELDQMVVVVGVVVEVVVVVVGMEDFQDFVVVMDEPVGLE